MLMLALTFIVSGCSEREWVVGGVNSCTAPLKWLQACFLNLNSFYMVLDLLMGIIWSTSTHQTISYQTLHGPPSWKYLRCFRWNRTAVKGGAAEAEFSSCVTDNRASEGGPAVCDKAGPTSCDKKRTGPTRLIDWTPPSAHRMCMRGAAQSGRSHYCLVIVAESHTGGGRNAVWIKLYEHFMLK